MQIYFTFSFHYDILIIAFNKMKMTYNPISFLKLVQKF